MEKKIGFENSKNKIKFMTGPNPSNKKQSEHHYKQLIWNSTTWGLLTLLEHLNNNKIKIE